MTILNSISNNSLAEAFGLHGETALVTGGGTGLGLGIAKCLAAAGARVILVGRRESELAKAVLEIGRPASYFVHDITRLEAASGLIAKAESAAGSPVSILVNNAGIHLKKNAIETTPDDFNTMLATHVTAAHSLNRAVLPGMVARRHGAIVMTTSMAALMGVPMVIAYTAAKSACTGMTRALAAEVSEHGVRVNAIAPGWIDSPMLRSALAGDKNREQKILSRTPAGKFGDPADIGWAAVYLCSPAAKFVTGCVFAVDGGASGGF